MTKASCRGSRSGTSPPSETGRISTINVDLRFYKCTISGSTITISSVSPSMGSGDCSGPCAFVDSTATGLPTVACVAGSGDLYVMEFMVPTATGIAPDVTLALTEFGNVRGLKSVWACDVVGEYRGPHRLNAVMSYPDEPSQPDTTFGPFSVTGAPYVFEVNPMVEQTSSYGLRVYVDFVGVPTPGASMALELLSFEVGIEPTLAKVRDAQRIPGR